MLTLGVLAGLAIGAVRVIAARSGRSQVPAIPPLRWWWLALVGLAVQLALTLAPGPGWASPWRIGLLLAAQVLVAAVVAANLYLRWMWVVLVGVALNILVMVANGGLMPISPQTLQHSGNAHVLARVPVGAPLPRSKDVILPEEQIHLAPLADRISMPGRPGSFSAGDVLIALGVALVLAAAPRVGVPAPGHRLLMPHSSASQSPRPA